MRTRLSRQKDKHLPIRWVLILYPKQGDVMEDIRVLCRRCADSYRTFGYILQKTNDFKEPCFICNKLGFEYKLKKPKQRGGKSGK